MSLKRGQRKKGAESTPGAAIAQQEQQQRQKLVEAALAKTDAGKSLSSRERAAVKAWEKDQIERWGGHLIENFPKNRLCDLIGVHQRVMLEKSRTFGWSYHTSGKTCKPIDLIAEFIAWTTEHKVGIKRMLRAEQVSSMLGDEDDGLDFWQTELVKNRAMKIAKQLEDMQGENAPREIVHDILQEVVVTSIRRRLDKLGKRTGSVSVEEITGWYREDIEQAQRACEQLFGDRDEPGTKEPSETDSKPARSNKRDAEE